jgi:hypothetical protein
MEKLLPGKWRIGIKICDRCKRPVDLLIAIELTIGWNYAKHVWKYKNLEICKNCQTHVKMLRDNAMIEAEMNICREFLEVRESTYESMR